MDVCTAWIPVKWTLIVFGFKFKVCMKNCILTTLFCMKINPSDYYKILFLEFNFHLYCCSQAHILQGAFPAQKMVMEPKPEPEDSDIKVHRTVWVLQNTLKRKMKKLHQCCIEQLQNQLTIYKKLQI